MSNFKDVESFHSKFDLVVGDGVSELKSFQMLERIQFMQEELNEFTKGCATEDLAEQADALVDLVYVTLGTAVMMGLPWKDLWDDVQQCNMSKVKGITHRGHKVDVTKPPGWKGPSTQEILDFNLAEGGEFIK